jgi:hypothetical protein
MPHHLRMTSLATAAGILLLALSGCVEAPAVKADLGPTSYDASGTMPCSAGAPSFDQACGWRVVRNPGGGAEIWISNIAVRDRPAYRVLRFDQGEFTARDGAPLQVSKDADTWTVTADGNEHYRFADALITGG